MDRPAVLSTFSLILPGGAPTTISPAAAVETPALETYVRRSTGSRNTGSRNVAPPDRRDRRPAAGSADRARVDRLAGRRQQTAQRRRRAPSTGARGRDPAPPCRPQQRSDTGRQPRADLARAARRDDPDAGCIFGRGLRPAHGARF